VTVRALLLRYGDAHHESAAAALTGKVLDRAFPGEARDVVVIDNALPPGFAGATPEGWPLVGGDNSLLEFSGWERGLALRSAVWDAADPVILVNDTFHRNYDVAYLERFGLEPAARWAAEGALVGHVDLYPREIALFGLAMRFWLRTSFLLARWGTLSRLLPFAPPARPEELFVADAHGFFAPGDALGPRYREYLQAFLLGGASEYGCRWHTKIAADAEGLARLRRKAYAIVCEHWLAPRARQLGIPLRDVSGWLDRRIADMDAMAAKNAGGEAA
jgi:hypothetical protein